MAPADGAGRRREQVPGQTGRTAPVVRLGVPVAGSGPGGRCGPGERAGRVPGMVVQAPGLDNLGTGPVRAVLSAAGGLRAVGGDAAVMAEQATSGLAGLLRQLRAEARLTQQELAKAAGVSPRSVSDLERGINRTARQDTAVRLAGALGLAEPVRSLFVAAARGRIPAAQVLAARRGQAPGESPASAGGMHGFVPALTSFVGRAGPVREVAAPAGPQPAGDGDRAGRHGEDPARSRGGPAGGRPVRRRGLAGGAGAGRRLQRRSRRWWRRRWGCGISRGCRRPRRWRGCWPASSCCWCWITAST